MNSTTVNVATGIQGPTENTLYRALSDNVSYQTGPNSEIMYSPFQRKTHVVPASSAAFLQACRTFATLDQHSRTICAQFKIAGNEWTKVKLQLQGLVKVGLLISETEMIQRAVAPPAQESEPAERITVLAIPTKNRTELLEQSLKSYIECSRTFGRTIRFLVADDSTDDATIEANRRVMRALKKEYGVEILHSTWREKDIFATAIAQEAGLPKELMEFALGQTNEFVDRIGANRNSILLMTVDEMIVQADDDTICLMSPGPAMHHGLTLTSQNDPTEFWFPQETEMKNWHDKFELKDLYAVHESLLGKSVYEIAKNVDQPINISNTNTSFYRKLEANGKVIVTAPGHAGDSGMGSSVFFLAMQGANRARLHASERTYLDVLRLHKLMRATGVATISDGAYCMSMNLGLDNRNCLPPFMPVQRNSDGIFGFTIKATSPDGLLGYLPYMIQHKRPELKESAVMSQDNQWQKFARTRFADLFMALASSLPATLHTTTEERMRALGRSLMDFGSLPPAAFEERTRLTILKICSQQIASLNVQMNGYKKQPAYWAQDVQSYIDSLTRYVHADDFGVPRDLVDTFGLERARTSTMKAIYFYGELLRNWPAIRNAARALKSRGHEPYKVI